MRVNGQEMRFYVPLPEETDFICELLDAPNTGRFSSPNLKDCQRRQSLLI